MSNEIKELSLNGKVTIVRNYFGDCLVDSIDMDKLWDELHCFFDDRGLQFCGELVVNDTLLD